MAGCIFCRIVSGEIPATILYSDEQFVAFADAAPQAPTHILVVPRVHVETLLDLDEKSGSLVVIASLQAVARAALPAGTGFKLVVNNGADAGQSVPHLHFHILAGRPFAWPPG